MSTDADINALLERVKAATGPDLGIDEAVRHAIDKRMMEPQLIWRETFPYTASIDAAVAMTERVLPGWEWQVRKTGYVELHHPTHHLKDEVGYGATPPLAILAATLSALIATSP